MLAEALAAVDKSEERLYEAELYRLKGELTLQQSVEQFESRVQTGQSQSLQTQAKPDPKAQAEAEGVF